jgi:hypothetical protein
MAVALVAAGAGLFGGGLLSETAVTAGDELTVEYPRFGRAHAPLELVIDWRPRQAESSLWVSREYLDDFEIAEIRPAPSAVAADQDRIAYTFRTGKPDARVGVTFMLEAKYAGMLEGRIGTAGELEVEIRQFVFP